MKKLLININVYDHIFLIGARPKRSVKVLFHVSFMLRNCFDRYKIHEMCEKSADAYSLALARVSDWFVMPDALRMLALISLLLGVIDVKNARHVKK